MSAMPDALRVLLGRAIDYAGLFPPAQLPMAEALGGYAGELRSPERWLLARFVCPVARLAEVEPLLDGLLPPGPPLMLAALGTGAECADAFLAGLAAEAATVGEFVARHRGRVAADQFEVSLPGELVARGDPDAVAGVVREAGRTLARRGAAWVLVACEAPVAGADPVAVEAVIEGIARAGVGLEMDDGWGACFKVRCGGAVAAAYPTCEELARALAACRDRDVPLKATQGLHHPFRHLNRAAGVTMHGFVNLLAGGVLARARGLGSGELAELLADEEPGHFELSDAGLAWRGHAVEVAEVAAGRRFAVRSFGSCSVAEPVADLRALGWLDAAEEGA